MKATFHTECGADKKAAACDHKTKLGTMLLEEGGDIGDGSQEWFHADKLILC